MSVLDLILQNELGLGRFDVLRRKLCWSKMFSEEELGRRKATLHTFMTFMA